VELNEKNVREAQEAEQKRVAEQRAKDLDLAMRVATTPPAPGQELTPEAKQLQAAAEEMLSSGTDPGFVAGYLRDKQERNRGGGRG
jgi:hypothetical protein